MFLFKLKLKFSFPVSPYRGWQSHVTSSQQPARRCWGRGWPPVDWGTVCYEQLPFTTHQHINTSTHQHSTQYPLEVGSANMTFLVKLLTFRQQLCLGTLHPRYFLLQTFFFDSLKITFISSSFYEYDLKVVKNLPWHLSPSHKDNQATRWITSCRHLWYYRVYHQHPEKMEFNTGPFLI